MSRKTLLALMLVGVLGACNHENLDTSIYETPEYQKQLGLALIKAATMLARNGSGEGIEVAVFDTGGSFSHPDLDANYSSSRYNIATYGTAEDGNGHGTHVAGIIAAEKNDIEMHGVAPSASIVSYKILDDAGSAIALNDTTHASAVTTMGSTNVMIINNSWGSSTSVTSVTANQFATIFPQTLSAFRSYDTLGGVQVWAVGNDSSSQPNYQSGLPYLFPDLEDGWLAVMAVDLDGNEPLYTNRCGVAAAWCLAAPGGSDNPATGGVYSTYKNGTYASLSGTSMATPHVSGALAALKSIFPNLSYKDVRARILETADSTGIYSNTAIYGQGLLDLAAASSPIGGTLIAASSQDSGLAVPTLGTSVSLPLGALSRDDIQENVLLLDKFQRAPFTVPLGAFVSTETNYLSPSFLALNNSNPDWNFSGRGFSAALVDSEYRLAANTDGILTLGFGQGAQIFTGFSRLSGSKLPHSNYRMARNSIGVTLGVDLDMGNFVAEFASRTNSTDEASFGYGVASWFPSSVISFSLVPESSNTALGISFATDLQKPSGWSGTGAFSLSGNSVSVGYSNSFMMSDGFKLGVTGRLTQVSVNQNALVRLSNSLVASYGIDLTAKLSEKASFGASLNMEVPITASKGDIRVGNSINSAGQITTKSITLNQSEMMRFTAISLAFKHNFSKTSTMSAGLTYVQDGLSNREGVARLGFKIQF
jgi:subtilisin